MDSINDNDSPAPMIAQSERDILERQDELEQLALSDCNRLIKSVIFKALAYEESKFVSPRARPNLAGMGKLLELLITLEERDGVLDDFPMESTEKALDFLLEKRSLGVAKSAQAKDLSELLSKKDEIQRLRELKTMLEEIKRTQVKPSFEVVKRESLTEDKE